VKAIDLDVGTIDRHSSMERNRVYYSETMVSVHVHVHVYSPKMTV